MPGPNPAYLGSGSGNNSHVPKPLPLVGRDIDRSGGGGGCAVVETDIFSMRICIQEKMKEHREEASFFR